MRPCRPLLAILGTLAFIGTAGPAEAQQQAEAPDNTPAGDLPFLPPGPELPGGIKLPNGPLRSGASAGDTGPRAFISARLEALNQGNLGSVVPGGLPDALLQGLLKLPTGPIGGRPTDLRAGLSWRPDAGTAWTLSWESTQQLREPLTNPDLIATAAQRQNARLQPLIGQDPRPVTLLREASLRLIDPESRGLWQFGQFSVPFGHDSWATVEPPMGLHAAETAATDALARAGFGTVQPFAMVNRLDVGTALDVRTGSNRTVLALFNGTGPQRLDDDNAKDLLLRTTWTDGASDSFGLSWLAGEGRPLLAGSPLSPAWGSVVPKRMYGVHLGLGMGPILLKGEWCSRTDLGHDPGPRQGWVLEASLPGSPGEATYAQWTEANSPATPLGAYKGRTWTIGLRNRIAPRTFWRAEFSDRREELGSLILEQQRTLTSIDLGW